MFTVELENKDKPKEIKKLHHSSLQDNVLTF